MANVHDLCVEVDKMRKKDAEGNVFPWSSKDEFDENYMSDMSHWLCVHVTKFIPQRNNSGKLFIPTTAMATHNELPRTTVHVTLNQIVYSHMFGSWDAMPIVVLAPYQGVVKENGNPTEVASEDTYFIPNPDTGLVLPKNSCVVKSDNSSLFHIGDKVATYKTDYFTSKEIETILSLVDSGDREFYNKLLDGEKTGYEIEWLLAHDKKLLRVYENAKDKRAFMRGLFEEDRMVILTRFLRNAVVRMMMEKMGYNYVFSHEDNISGRVSLVAQSAGLNATSGNKGHSGSWEKDMEDAGVQFACLMETFRSLNIDEIYKDFVRGRGTIDTLAYGFIRRPLIESILSDTVPDVHGIYKGYFETLVDWQIEHTECDIGWALEYHKQYNEPLDKLPALQKKLERAKEFKQKGLVKYNPYLATAFDRHASRMKRTYVNTVAKLKATSKYSELQKYFDDFVNERVNKFSLVPENVFLGLNKDREYE